MTREEIIELIDFSKLSKDYLDFKNRKVGELPDYFDFYYLYIDLNLNADQLALFFQTKSPNIFVWAKKLNIKKSKELSNLSRRKTCLQKYGSESVLQNDLIKEKIKHSCLQKYGVDNIFKDSAYIKQKFEEKYGVSNPMQDSNIKKKYSENYKEKTGYTSPFENKDIQEKIERTNLEKYGVSNPMQNSNISNKSKNTRKEKYNKELNPENYKNFHDKLSLSLKEVLSENPEIINKRKQTKIEKYGSSSYINLEKIKRTKTEKYGDPNYNNRKKAQETCLNKYGVLNPSKIDFVKEKKKQTFLSHYGKNHYFQTEEFQTEAEQTFLKKYGSVRFTKSDTYKDLYKDKERTKRIMQKSYQTKKQNNSFNKSTPEKELLQLLLQKFPDTISQYRSDVYPFNCDFYIPSKDLYIEYQGSWTHGYKPFVKDNKECQEQLKSWKDKAIQKEKETGKRSFYSMAIYVWSNLDTRKREIAKENNLNYLEFFNKEEFMNWFNQQESK